MVSLLCRAGTMPNSSKGSLFKYLFKSGIGLFIGITGFLQGYCGGKSIIYL